MVYFTRVILTREYHLWKASALSKMSHQFHRGARAARRIQMWQQARQLHMHICIGQLHSICVVYLHGRCPTLLYRHCTPRLTACILQRAPRTAHRAPRTASLHPLRFTGQIRHGRRYRCHRGRSGGHCASLGGCDGPGWLGRGRRHGGRRGRGGRIQGGPHQHPLTHWGGTELEFELSQAGRQRACRLGTGRACVHAERGERGSAHDTAQMNVYSDASDSIMDPM